MSVPSSILPPLRQQRDASTWIGTARPTRLKASRAPKIAALHLEDVLCRLDDDQVGAALDQAAGLLVEDLGQLREGDLAEGRVVGWRAGTRSGRSSRRRSAPSPAALRAIWAALRLISSVCSPRPHSSSFSREPWKVSVSTTSAPASSIDVVDALDHVGAVQDQRLVALAREPAVILAGELEALQGRAHPAVEDDDALAGCGKEVASPVGSSGGHLHRSRLSHRAAVSGESPVAAASRSGSLSRSGWRVTRIASAGSPCRPPSAASRLS